MPATVRVAIEESSQIAEVRRAIQKMASDLGFDEIRSGQMAIVATEAATNILKHATRGEILLSTNGDQLELLALDSGPGMHNLEHCLQDGVTSASSPGQGLGAIRRLSNESDFYSVESKGTAILARWRPPVRPRLVNGPSTDVIPLHIGFVNVSKRGQEVCGDSWGAEQSAEVSTIMVADGLGHGYEASTASLEAVRILHDHAELSPQLLLERTHQALRSSRGAAVAVARIDHFHRKLTFSGVGNIMAQVYSGSQPGQHLVSVNGTAGHQTQRLREFAYPWPESGMLVLSSDGLATSMSLLSQPALAFCDPSLIAGVLYRDFARGHDDATVVVAKTSTNGMDTR